ncbi:MAG: hypothetical protein KDC83_04715 [Flavobacteriales bacterium]|nr:hypothetical protein [Flavobacteriales bacterium]
MNEKPYLVGIVGGSGSGKSSFINALKASLPNEHITVVSQDNYYLPIDQQKKDENGWVNFDLPSSIDRQAFYNDLQKLMNGQSIEIHEYNFNNATSAPQVIKIEPTPIIIMEGLFVMHYTEIADLLDLKLYIEVDEEIKLARRINRDATERGYPEEEVRYQWEHHVLPSFQQYLLPYRSQAHLIINNNINFNKGLMVIKNHLKAQAKIMAGASIRA